MQKIWGTSAFQRRTCHQKPLLIAPKDKDPILKKSGVIYRYKCDTVECDEGHIGESARTFAERFKEHFKAPSPIYDLYNTSGHNVTKENFSIVGREDQNLMRNIKEALYKGQQSIPKQKHRQIPSVTHMG